MTEIFVNPNRGSRSSFAGRPAVAPGVQIAPRDVHRRLPGYAVTPLVDAATLAAEFGFAHLWVKNESSRLHLPAFKILGASWATYRLLVGKLGHEPAWRDVDELRVALAPLGALTLVAATDGNHGRAVARTAKLLGYGAHILVPAGTVPARIEGIESEGAAVTVVDGTYDDAVAASAALADDSSLVVSDTSWPGYMDVPGWVIEGYETIFAETDEQLAGASPDVVMVQMGVGALAAAVVGHYASRSVIVGVEPVSAACNLESARAGAPAEVPGPHRSIMAGLNCGNVSPVAWPRVGSGIDVFVAVEDNAAERAMRDLAREGIVAGESGAAGLAGLYALLDSEAVRLGGASVLVLCTEGATDPVAYQRIVGDMRR
jgi:diaminopropionate ammonia-lyase